MFCNDSKTASYFQDATTLAKSNWVVKNEGRKTRKLNAFIARKSHSEHRELMQQHHVFTPVECSAVDGSGP